MLISKLIDTGAKTPSINSKWISDNTFLVIILNNKFKYFLHNIPNNFKIELKSSFEFYHKTRRYQFITSKYTNCTYILHQIYGHAIKGDQWIIQVSPTITKPTKRRNWINLFNR